jgi:ArsR family transcriptional regulator, arsenate/arsenite/antimonite-responsive transcriptional repressor / arsenate reductase (thioredoxin)
VIIESTNIDLLAQRARIHAALANPTRLAIVDALSLSDASPTELQALVGAPSNLLAHHVNVLEAEGIVARRCSEGDRRRTYLRLIASTPDWTVPAAPLATSRVVFVCTANSARSQLASAMWGRASAVASASAGTHPANAVDPGAIAAARRHEVPLRPRRPRPLTEILSDTDLVITVCDNAHEELESIKSLHWSVPDPVPAGSEKAFDAAVEEISRRVCALAPHVRAS